MVLRRLRKGSKVIRGAVREIGANLVAARLYPLGLFEKNELGTPHTHVSKNPRPILLVHGVIHNRSAFMRMKNNMEKKGWDNIFTMNYSTFHGHILQMVEELGEKIEMVMNKTDSRQIDIVAHSLGGVVSRTYMSLGEGRGKVKRLVTLGTPHQGTRLSFVAKGLSRGALGVDLRNDSYLIRLLMATELPKSSEIVSIYSPFDWTVVPSKSAECKGKPEAAFKNIEIDYVGHTGLLYSPVAFDAVVSSILSPEV
jgi:triacylglycerol lipase